MTLFYKISSLFHPDELQNLLPCGFDQFYKLDLQKLKLKTKIPYSNWKNVNPWVEIKTFWENMLFD